VPSSNAALVCTAHCHRAANAAILFTPTCCVAWHCAAVSSVSNSTKQLTWRPLRNTFNCWKPCKHHRTTQDTSWETAIGPNSCRCPGAVQLASRPGRRNTCSCWLPRPSQANAGCCCSCCITSYQAELPQACMLVHAGLTASPAVLQTAHAGLPPAPHPPGCQ
jgi:hypothetical protein